MVSVFVRKKEIDYCYINLKINNSHKWFPLCFVKRLLEKKNNFDTCTCSGYDAEYEKLDTNCAIEECWEQWVEVSTCDLKCGDGNFLPLSQRPVFLLIQHYPPPPLTQKIFC